MKKVLLLVAIAGMFASCGHEQEQKNQALTNSNDSLLQVVAVKDSIINDAFTSISEIAANINQVTQRENLVTTQSAGELTKPAKEQIAANMAAISELLEQNRATIARLQSSTKKLKAANVKIDALQNLVAQLQEQLQQKDVQLAALTEQVRSLNIEVKSLGRTVSNLEGDKATLQSTVANQDAALNRVYYIIGQDKELIKKDIIDKKGVIGRTRVVSDGASMDDFTSSDARQLERITIGKSKVRIVTNHPSNSYMLVKGAKDITEELVITDKDAFWRNSKILVVSYK